MTDRSDAVRGALFTRYFLTDGIRDTPHYRSLDPVWADAAEHYAAQLWSRLAAMPRPSEADTEEVLILPLLRHLGWSLLPQASADAGRRDIADALLFPDDAALAAARAQRHPVDRLRHGAVIVENEARDTPLDRASGKRETPSSQLLRYLGRGETHSGGRLRWGMLTNGKLWRLYHARARSRAEGYTELDLGAVLDAPDGPDRDHWLRVFLLLFRAEAHAPAPPRGATFLDDVLAEGKRHEQALTGALSRAVFDRVFPELVAAIGRETPGARPADPAWRAAVWEAGLRLLYRLLFLLYAEDRNLLPVQHRVYAHYSLLGLRREAEHRVDRDDLPPEGVRTWWPRLAALFDAISRGNAGMGLPSYNGGLFDDAQAPLLGRLALSDRVLVPLLDAMSRADLPEGRRWINYRDLSVQQLGSIYERLLERDVVADGAGGLALRDNAEGRRGSGSYYTPEELVRLILRRAVGPLLAERRERFRNRAEALRGARGPLRAEALHDMAALDPATAFLSLRVCDPAMGSGHFLVSLVDYLADEVLTAMTDAPALVPAREGEEPYRSPLARRIEALRAHILAQAEEHGWVVERDQLDDKHLVRRIILKRVIYGADLNRMAVELAKLSLWLHSFTVGAPLSFLDHHLRCGDSLCGEGYASATGDRAGQSDLFLRDAHNQARGAAGYMQRIEDATDADIGEVERSSADYQVVLDGTRPLRRFLDLVHARRWMTDLKEIEAAAYRAALDGRLGDPVALAAGTAQPRGPAAHRDAAMAVLARARHLAQQRRFLHWQVAFPGVWTEWERAEPPGGFDAVVGNPPYVRQESIKDAKPALKALYQTYDGTADLYVYFFERALSLLRPGGRLAFVVTNKWLKSGYAEALRGHLAERAWVEAVIDFGHAKGFFPDADVMPCVAVVRRPIPGEDGPAQTGVAVIPAAEVAMGGLEAQVETARYPLPRARLTRAAWVLEPPEVLALLDKLRRAGTPLREYAGCGPRRGVLTGYNDAFVVDQATRDRLVREDPRSEELIRPYLRGQDVDRWAADWDGQWMIFARHGTKIDEYPAIKAHFNRFRRELEPKPADWAQRRPGETWPGRKPGSYEWFEIQDNVGYWREFDRPKIVYQEIQFYASYCIEREAYLINNKAFFIAGADEWLVACLNSPLMWWHNWRALPHMKDEALSPMGFVMEQTPIAPPPASLDAENAAVAALCAIRREAHETRRLLAGWYRHSWGIEKPGQKLQDPFDLDADRFTAALQKALPAKQRRLTVAALADIRREHGATVAPVARRLAEAERHERALSALVNRAYGLTPEEEALMWRTAPPRMPLPPPAPLAAAAD